MTENGKIEQKTVSTGFTARQVIGMIIASMCIAMLVTVVSIKIFLFPSPFKPVVLSAEEEQQLTTKLEQFESPVLAKPPETAESEYNADGTIRAEEYSEANSSREISFTERELNALMAKNTDLAQKLAIDLADDTVSIKLLIPLDPDFPVMGGKTLKVKAGAELAYREGRPVVKLKGLSLMGIPMPNSWLGGLKNIDLIGEFGVEEGFWKSFADGIDSIIVTDGFLKIKLKE